MDASWVGLSPATTGLLLVAGLAAGGVNAVAGGGTFFSFAALLATGLPPVTANATSALAMVPGYMSSAAAYRREIHRDRHRLLLPGVASVCGGLIGALLLVRIGNDAFKPMVPWLLLIATVLFAVGPSIAKWMRKGASSQPAQGIGARVGGAFGQFALAIYGGFFGAGMGIVLLAILALTEGDDFHQINAAKNVHSILIQLTAVVLFVVQGMISWPGAIVLLIAGIVGGWGGVWLARKLAQQRIRAFVMFVAVAMTAWYMWREYGAD